jgi:hypothetical protein
MPFNPCHRAIASNFFMINPVPVQINSNLLKTHSFNEVGEDAESPNDQIHPTQKLKYSLLKALFNFIKDSIDSTTDIPEPLKLLKMQAN